MASKDNIRRRAACDRCHSQKLRCTKTHNSEICDRCIKARATCHFSPFRQKPDQVEPPDLSKSVLTHVAHSNQSSESETSVSGRISSSVGHKRKRDSQSPIPEVQRSLSDLSSRRELSFDNIDFGWMSNDFSYLHNLEFDSSFNDFVVNGNSDKLLENIPGIAPDLTLLNSTSNPTSNSNEAFDFNFPAVPSFMQSPHPTSYSISNRSEGYISSAEGRQKSVSLESSSSSSTSPIDSCIHQLSNLSINLYEHEATIPPQSIHESPMLDEEIYKLYPYSVDETFRLTQTLVDIYPKFMSKFVKIKQPDPSRTLDISRQEFSGMGSGFEKPTAKGLPDSQSHSHSQKPPIDHSAILLILSCHLRLIEIYEQLFQHVEKCIIGGSKCHSAPEGVGASMPELRIGTYVPPQEAAVPMQMLLLIHLASQLNTHAGNLAKQITAEQLSEGSKDRAFRNKQFTMQLSQLTAETVRARASHMQEELTQLRVRMLQTGFLA
ncbi:hypothetical protein F5884DRAFT_862217 [Xylogone sp. PMI_703]|nr:hypothetical protein F5884DRAFT_862217 [Xylogone sp. PMI_703]